MTYSACRYLVLSNLYRVSDRLDLAALLNHVLRGSACIPGRVISNEDSAGYVNRTDYDGRI